MKGGGVGACRGASRVCDRFAFAGDRSPWGWRGRAGTCWWRERGWASDATHSRVAVPVSGGEAGVPAFGGAATGGDSGAAGAAGGGECLESSVELLGGEVAVHVVGELGAGEAVGGADQRGVELFGERVAGRLAERPAGGAGGVVPERERGVQVLGLDLGLAVEQCVDQREADGVRFGAGGDVPGEPVERLGELRVGVPPQLSRVGGEPDLALGVGVLQDRGEVLLKAGPFERVRDRRLRGAAGRAGRRRSESGCHADVGMATVMPTWRACRPRSETPRRMRCSRRSRSA